MKLKLFCSVVSSVIFLVLSSSVPARAQIENPQPLPLLDAEISNLAGSPYAVINLQGAYCSGVLVGKDAVLTAAHCVCLAKDAKLIVVDVGGKKIKALSAVKPSTYNCHSDEPTSNAMIRSDIGVIQLAESVENVSPLPIFSDFPVREGQRLSVVGYGESEKYSRGVPKATLGRIGKVEIYESVDGVFSTYPTELAPSSVCLGDSGGPALIEFAGVWGVVGVTSATSNFGGDGVCIPFFGDSAYSSLSSRTARNFLTAFPNINQPPSRELAVRHYSNQIVGQLNIFTETEQRSLNQMRRTARSALGAARRLYTYTSGHSKKLVESAIKYLKRARNSRRRSAGERDILRAVRKIQSLLTV